MAFIQPCFIRKNTAELRKKLEELRYKPFGSVKYEWDTGWGLSIDNRLGEFESFDNNGLENIIKCESPDYEDSIDCGTNEDLFIALASMTDDEYGLCDYNIVITDCNPRYAKGSIHRALPLSSVIHPNCYRKATVEELIEHFNKK